MHFVCSQIWYYHPIRILLSCRRLLSTSSLLDKLDVLHANFVKLHRVDEVSLERWCMEVSDLAVDDRREFLSIFAQRYSIKRDAVMQSCRDIVVCVYY